MKKALLIIDVQNDYFPNGKCELYQSELALERVKALLQNFRDKQLPIFFVQHVSSADSSFFVPETEGVCIHKSITPLRTEEIIVKHHPNSFLKTSLHRKLQALEVNDLVVCGMMTHMCVDTTIRAAYDYGFHTTLISDACATKDLDWNGTIIPAVVVQNVYMSSVNYVFANVMTSKEYLSR